MTGGDEERLVAPVAETEAGLMEGALRPKRLGELVGQSRVREQLSLVLEGALGRGKPADHVLLCGPPGLGKTTIAMIIAAELGAPLRVTSGPATGPPCCPGCPRARWCSSTRFTASPGPPRRCSTWPWRISGSTW